MALFRKIGQAGKIGLVEKQRPVAFVGQQVLTECRAERGEFLVDGGKPLLALRVQLGTRPDEALPGLFQHAPCFGIQVEAGTALVKIVNAGKQRLVHRDGREMPRHLRSDFAFQRPDRLVGMRAGPAPEDRRDVVQRLAGQFQRRQCIVDGRFVLVTGDLLDLGLMRLQGGIEDRAEIAIAYPVEVRKPERAVPCSQRVGGEVGGFGHGEGLSVTGLGNRGPQPM